MKKPNPHRDKILTRRRTARRLKRQAKRAEFMRGKGGKVKEKPFMPWLRRFR